MTVVGAALIRAIPIAFVYLPGASFSYCAVPQELLSLLIHNAFRQDTEEIDIPSVGGEIY